MKNTTSYKRLESLDVLRGIDLFFLVFLQPVIAPLVRCIDNQTLNSLYYSIFTHVSWIGFHPWDLIMPLFMFMAGASMPFAFSAYHKGLIPTYQMLKRIAKRVVLLWLFGALVQGNLLDLDLHSLRLFSNTLQAIAVGYFFAALLLMFCKLKAQVIITASLLIIYSIAMQVGGDFSAENNFAEQVDQLVLGRFRDGVSWDEAGNWNFASYYRYTWIFSSLNFIVTVMLGVFSGLIVKQKISDIMKMKLLTGIGIVMLVSAFALSFIEPIIKQLWTSSMTLYAGGWSFLLIALFYWLIDVKQCKKGFMWLKFYGMNSILAYMMYQLLDVTYPVTYWLHGLAQFTGCYQNFIIELGKALLVLLILRFCYKHNVFLKV